MTYRYRPVVLEELAAHGLRPTPATPPQLVRDYLSDLYRYEIRRLKARLLRGDIPKADYNAHVVALRKQYPLLSVPLALWTESEE
jgi:hypothetical protein